MKNIILAVTVALSIFASTGAFARGFSVGVLGSYAIDNGVVDDSWEQITDPFLYTGINSNHNLPIIAGGVFFIEYNFKNNLFLRTGFESYFTTKDGHVIDTSITEEYNLKYNAFAIPVFAGIRLSPDRGRTSVYGAAGIFYANVSIEREVNMPSLFEKTVDSSSDFIGIGGLLGLEKKLIFNTFLVIEYAFYKGSDDDKFSEFDSTSWGTYDYYERYGLPAQQLRVGLKYNF